MQLPLVHSALAPQTAPFARSAHAPAPLQFVAPGHSFAGSVALGTLLHVPMLPDTLHALQTPTHEVLQHTPSMHCMLAHSLFAPHAAPFGPPTQAAAPLHTCAPVHSLAGSWRFGMFVQVPTVPARLHALQAPTHVELQHTPSTQLVLVHSVPSEQAVPFENSAQTPLPLQFVAPGHSAAGSWPEPMLEHVPTRPARLHALHVPPHAASQHTPSAQKPLAQSPATTHEPPFGVLQTPAPLHTSAPAHSFDGSCSAGMFRHVPTFIARTHDWQFPPQVALQHTPSVQKPLWHSVPSMQAVPLPKRLPHAPVPLQLTAPAHSFAGSMPNGMFVQVPCVPMALHTWHVPAQALLQQ
jgi:hypothetical protein